MVKIENPTRFKFDTPEGEKSLTDLFDGRNQLIIYHFMNKAAFVARSLWITSPTFVISTAATQPL